MQELAEQLVRIVNEYGMRDMLGILAELADLRAIEDDEPGRTGLWVDMARRLRLAARRAEDGGL